MDYKKEPAGLFFLWKIQMITKIPYKLIFTLPSILIVLLIFYADHQGPLVYAPVGVMISAIAALTAATATIKSNRHTFMQTNSLGFRKTLQDDKHYNKSIKVVSKAMANRLKKPLVEYAKSAHLLTYEEQKVLTSIRYVLNTWEQAALSCRHHLYDEQHLYQSHKTMVIEIGIFFREFIHEVQIARNNPDIYNNLTWLILHWTIRRDDFTNKQTKNELILVYKQLASVKAGKLPKRRHKLKTFK